MHAQHQRERGEQQALRWPRPPGAHRTSHADARDRPADHGVRLGAPAHRSAYSPFPFASAPVPVLV
ncbi:MAG TPA: hypothetical protein K8W00_08825, partial [Kitasatospora aureofaciens]|uniref:hypothetical protein n=1 Tax=Kitasatospora aureofaciens TaxID=1894 RepID=UPI001D525B2A